MLWYALFFILSLIKKFSQRAPVSLLNSTGEKLEITEVSELPEIHGKLYYFLETTDSNDSEKIIKKEIIGISIYLENKIYYMSSENSTEEKFAEKLKQIMEDDKIEKYGYDMASDYILLKQMGITIKNMVYDAKVAAYILNPTSKYTFDVITSENYMDFVVHEE